MTLEINMVDGKTLQYEQCTSVWVDNIIDCIYQYPDGLLLTKEADQSKDFIMPRNITIITVRE